MLVVCKEIKPLAGYTHVQSFNRVYLVLRMNRSKTTRKEVVYFYIGGQLYYTLKDKKLKRIFLVSQNSTALCLPIRHL